MVFLFLFLYFRFYVYCFICIVFFVSSSDVVTIVLYQGQVFALYFIGLYFISFLFKKLSSFFFLAERHGRDWARPSGRAGLWRRLRDLRVGRSGQSVVAQFFFTYFVFYLIYISTFLLSLYTYFIIYFFTCLFFRPLFYSVLYLR